MTVDEALRKYVKQKDPPPHLVIEDEGLPADQMVELGFVLEDGYWAISYEDAEAALSEFDGVDFAEHWEQERKRDWTV